MPLAKATGVAGVTGYYRMVQPILIAGAPAELKDSRTIRAEQFVRLFRERMLR